MPPPLRRTLDGKNPNGWIPEQRITVAQAVHAYTMGSAFAEHQETVKGSIEPGKLADLVVLSDDIFTIAARGDREDQSRHDHLRRQGDLPAIKTYRSSATTPNAAGPPSKISSPTSANSLPTNNTTPNPPPRLDTGSVSGYRVYQDLTRSYVAAMAAGVTIP